MTRNIIEVIHVVEKNQNVDGIVDIIQAKTMILVVIAEVGAEVEIEVEEMTIINDMKKGKMMMIFIQGVGVKRGGIKMKKALVLRNQNQPVVDMTIQVMMMIKL